MTKALITGGAGFIGSHLCDRLVKQGVDVAVIDDFSLGLYDNIAHLEGQIELVCDSVLNIGNHPDLLDGVDRIYHLAALISGYDSLETPREYVDTNLNGLFELIDAAKDTGARIIFASSSTVYGNQPDPVYAESDPVHPPTVYALTKRSGEQTLALYSQMHDFDYVCLRLFNVYGPRQNPDHPYANVTCKFSHAAATHAQIKRFGNGRQSRDFVYVDDVIDAFIKVSERSEHRIYNVGTGQVTTINDLIGTFERIADKPFDIEQCPPWPNDIHTIRADTTRIEREFGFRPKVSLEQGLAQTVEYFR